MKFSRSIIIAALIGTMTYGEVQAVSLTHMKRHHHERNYVQDGFDTALAEEEATKEAGGKAAEGAKEATSAELAKAAKEGEAAQPGKGGKAKPAAKEGDAEELAKEGVDKATGDKVVKEETKETK